MGKNSPKDHSASLFFNRSFDMLKETFSNLFYVKELVSLNLY